MISAELIIYLALATFGVVLAFGIWQRVKVEKKKKSDETPELADLDMYKN